MTLILEKFNLAVFQAINGLAGRWNWLDLFLVFCAGWLIYLILFYVVASALKREDLKRAVFLPVGAAILARFVLVEAVRYFIYSPRPFLVLENMKQLISHEPTSSFPSGHTSFIFALVFGTYLINKKAGLWLLIPAVLTGFSRIFVGVHWPLDVVAGVVAGWLAVMIMSKFFQK